jgi:ethanolamine utilization protein EutN
MFLGKVIGQVVSTRKDPAMQGRKLVIVRPLLIDEENPGQFRPGVNTIVAVDNLGAGNGQVVIFCQGSSARLAEGFKSMPVDAAITGLVDTVEVLGKRIYRARDDK